MLIAHEDNSPLSHRRPFDTLVAEMIQHVRNSVVIARDTDFDLQRFLSQFDISTSDYIIPNCHPRVLMDICLHQSFCTRRCHCSLAEPTCIKPTDEVQATEHCGLFYLSFPVYADILYVYYSFGDVATVRNNIAVALIGYCKGRLDELNSKLSLLLALTEEKYFTSFYLSRVSELQGYIKAYEDFLKTTLNKFLTTDTYKLFEL